jgi:hypothetical protein
VRKVQGREQEMAIGGANGRLPSLDLLTRCIELGPVGSRTTSKHSPSITSAVENSRISSIEPPGGVARNRIGYPLSLGCSLPLPR